MEKFYKNVRNENDEYYTQYTALDIINSLDDIGFNTRHSYDAVMQFYHDKGLDLGFATKILKDFR